MTLRDRLLTGLLCGGVLALAVANLIIRFREARHPKPDYLSPEAHERVLRLASAQQGCCTEE